MDYWTIQGMGSIDEDGHEERLMPHLMAGPKLRPGESVRVARADALAGAVEALEHIANWKEFYDRNVAAWDEDRYGRLTIGSYVRSVLDPIGWQ